MSAEQFFACIGEIEDRFIEEAELYRKSARKAFLLRRDAEVEHTPRGGGAKNSHPFLRWIPVAACLALLAVGGLRFIQLKGGIPFSSGSNNGAAGGQAESGQQGASSNTAFQDELCGEETADGEEPLMATSSSAAANDSANRQETADGTWTDGGWAGTAPEEKIAGASSVVFQYPAKYIQTNGYTEGREYPYTVVIRSEDELAEYVSANEGAFDFANSSDAAESFCEAIEAYDGAYFENGTLVFAVLEEGSCSVRHQVEGITAENEILVERLVPDAQDVGLAEWHIILEIPADSPTLQSEQSFIVEEFEEQGDN